MTLVHTRQDLRKLLTPHHRAGNRIGFTPTMGALHEGHLSLARRAKSENDLSVMSVFVNPTQFGPQEDFQAYPRQLEKDCALAREAGVDVIFAPTSEEMYGTHCTTFVEETELTQSLCGAFRPGHFRGVCTIILKLFHAVEPTHAYFGQKDAQQLRVIEKMTEDLNLTVKIVGCPTLREPNGLAMSSRNAYLSAEERRQASKIYAALQKAEHAFAKGEYRSRELLASAASTISEMEEFKPQYMEIRAWKDFAPLELINEKAVLAVAGYLGKTRLIDNILLEP